MPASMKSVEALYAVVKRYYRERKAMERLSNKARNASLGRPSQKATVDLDWQAFEVNRIEHAVHAAAVDCGVADLRAPETYKEYSVRLSGFHEYLVTPERPKALTRTSAE